MQFKLNLDSFPKKNDKKVETPECEKTKKEGFNDSLGFSDEQLDELYNDKKNDDGEVPPYWQH